MDNYYLNHEGDSWRLEREGANRALRTFDTKDEAMKFSTDYVGEHGGSLRISKMDGTFQEERTYPRSADPRESKG